VGHVGSATTLSTRDLQSIVGDMAKLFSHGFEVPTRAIDIWHSKPAKSLFGMVVSPRRS
jgi:hypothetical protein